MAPAWVVPPPLLEPQKGADRSAAWAAVDQALKDRAWGTAAGGSIDQLWSAIQDLETAYLRQLTGKPQNLATRRGRVEPRAIAPKVGVDGDALDRTTTLLLRRAHRIKRAAVAWPVGPGTLP